VRAWLLHPGKVFTQPFLWLLVIALGCLLAARRGSRRAVRLALAALIVLWILSMQVTGDLLLGSLTIPAESGDPEVIAILSGGSDRELGLLSSQSSARVAAGVEWWREHPRARLVMSGADVTTAGTSTRTLELMRDLAVDRGVPPQRIELETWSTRTLEHPRGLLRLPGITRATRVGVVTSDWHMRRARSVFRRWFADVTVHPIAASTPPRLLNDFLPCAGGLSDTTYALQEWIGIAWYALVR